jgi:hypothetical protein
MTIKSPNEVQTKEEKITTLQKKKKKKLNQPIKNKVPL